MKHVLNESISTMIRQIFGITKCDERQHFSSVQQYIRDLEKGFTDDEVKAPKNTLKKVIFTL